MPKILMILLAFALSGNVFSQKVENKVIEGIVISDKTGKPVVNAHVYIVDGEVEALTNSKGEFRIETTLKTPLKLVIEEKDHEKTVFTVEGSLRKRVFRVRARG